MSETERRSRVLVVAMALVAIIAAGVGLSSAQPAPPLRAVVVEGVMSSRYPQWEQIPASAIATRIDHGGSTLLIQTREDGYGKTQIAKFNAANMRLIQSTPVVDARRTVIGWRRIWQYNGNFTGGRFTFQATSMVGVPTVRSTALNIR